MTQNDQKVELRRKTFKTTKVIKLQWIASIWCQKHQTNAKLQKWSYFDEFQSIWRQNYQNIWVRSQNYKSNQITMDCIDLMSKQSKMLSYVAKHSKQRKSTKLIKLQWIASIWCENDQKRWGTSQNIQNNAKLQKWSNYHELHRFDVKTIKTFELRPKTTKVIKLQWIASIWCQKHQKCWTQNYKKVIEVRRKTFKTTQNWSNYHDFLTSKRWICIDLTLKRSKTLRYVAKLSKQRKTTKLIKLQWICIDLTSKQSKMLSYVAKHSKQRKSTKLIKLQWIASIWCQNNQKTQNYKSNQITINLYRFDATTIKNVELRRKTFNTTQNYESDQIIMHCIDLTSERSKMLSYVAKLQMWSYYDEFASIWRQNDNNNSKLRKWSNYNALHQFDVRTI